MQLQAQALYNENLKGDLQERSEVIYLISRRPKIKIEQKPWERSMPLESWNPQEGRCLEADQANFVFVGNCFWKGRLLSWRGPFEADQSTFWGKNPF